MAEMDHALQSRISMNSLAKRLRSSRNFQSTALLIGLLTVLAFATLPCFAQSGLESRITETINALVRVVNVLIVGFIVWAGFLIAKGEGAGFQRLVYGIVGLIVANGAYMIINYFS